MCVLCVPGDSEVSKMFQSGQPQHFRTDGQGTQSGEKGYGKGFQAGGPTGPYPVGEVDRGVRNLRHRRTKSSLVCQEVQVRKVLCSRQIS